ncbi:MAG: hypothetical protein ACAH80_13260 [Alphaproteobacteria bacterium]
MNSKFTKLLAACAIMAVSACAWQQPGGQAYWQRQEDKSALWMTGPKAQQMLDQDIAGCVREVDELVEMGALRETLPPDTHSEYNRALKASGDLAFYDSPTRHGDHMVAHTDFHDFDSCMRFRGWERVRYVRYQTAKQAQDTYKTTTELRLWGVTGDAAMEKQKEKHEKIHGQYNTVNP